MPSNKLRHFRLDLLSGASRPVLDYAEIKAQIVVMERIKAGEYTVTQDGGDFLHAPT